jgi:hypothetical protein
VPFASDIIYSIQSSTNLKDWSTDDVESVDAPNLSPPDRVTFRYRFPVSSTDRAYLRLRVIRSGGTP